MPPQRTHHRLTIEELARALGMPECRGVRFYRKEGNVLFNDALNTFYLRLYGVRHMVKDHSDRRDETC